MAPYRLTALMMGLVAIADSRAPRVAALRGSLV